MSFSLPRFLRRTPPSTLSLYFLARRIALPAGFNCDASPRAFLGAVREAVEALPRVNYEQVFADFERVDQLCDPIGQRALQSLVAGDSILQERIRSADSDESRSIIVLLENETVFDHALAVSYADRLRNGRSWSAFSIPIPATVIADVEHIKALEADVAAVLKKLDGTGQRLKIETFEHPTYDRGGNRIGLNVHYSLYAEGLPESHLEFEGEEPKRHTRRPVHEGAISYDPDQRVLDVFAKGGKPIREELAQSYTRNILGLNKELRPILLRSFYLDRLKRPMPFPTDAADGIKSVKLTLLRLRETAENYGRVTIEIDDSERTDIHSVSAQWFGDADPLMKPDWHVLAAKLRIVFFAERSGRRDKTLTIELRAPNGSSLREQIRHHQIISEKYLGRWRLIEGGDGS